MTTLTKYRRRMPSVFNSDAFDDPFFETFFKGDHWSPKIYASQERGVPFDLNKIEDDEGNPLALEFKFALSGYTKDDVKVEFDDGILTVSAVQAKEDTSHKTEMYRGITQRSFSHSYQLTDPNLNEVDIKAEMKDGLLTIVIPYKEKEETKRLIEIK